jgi:arylsulfatase
MPKENPELSGGAVAWNKLSEEKRQKTAEQMANHAGLVYGMDRGIGRVLKAIKNSGVENNTIVIFLSDNGASAEGAGFGPAWASASCTPLAYYKQYLYEGGISTPCLVKWPAQIKKGRRVSAMGHVMDLMATCIDVAGVPYPSEHDGNKMPLLQGKSLMPVFKGSDRSLHDHLCFEYKGKRAVRKGNWKAVFMPDATVTGKGKKRKQSRNSEEITGVWSLFDIDADRTEQTDLSDKHSDVLKDLTGLFDYWLENNYRHYEGAGE